MNTSRCIVAMAVVANNSIACIVCSPTIRTTNVGAFSPIGSDFHPVVSANATTSHWSIASHHVVHDRWANCTTIPNRQKSGDAILSIWPKMKFIALSTITQPTNGIVVPDRKTAVTNHKSNSSFYFSYVTIE